MTFNADLNRTAGQNPTYPNSGWGKIQPVSGLLARTYTVRATAVDTAGAKTDLGTKTITITF
jgi:hypothetical protein